MKYHFIILSLIAFVCIQSQTVLLTPLLPASAFENQFYQVRFRVRNLVGARFEFKNVPAFFTASSEGLLSGVPTKQGLYAIQVIYSNDTYKESKQVIIDVRRGTKLTNYNTATETQQTASPTPQLKPKQEYLFTYNQNDQLNIEVNVTNGQGPYTFQPIYVPSEMQFSNKTGSLAGAFHKYGDYLVGIKVKDGKGSEVQVLIKITIVVRSTTTPKFIFYQRSMLQVRFQVKQVAGNGVNALAGGEGKSIVPAKPATGAAGGSVNIVQTTTDQTKTVPPTPSKTTEPSKPTLPTQSDSTSLPSSTQQSPTATPPTIPQSLTTISQPSQIIPTQDIINKNITTDINMQKIQKEKDSLNRKLQQSKDQLKVCYDNVQVARKTVENLLNTYNEQFARVEWLKNQLQEQRTKSQRASVDLEEKLGKLKSYEVEKMLAEREYNRSQLSFDNVNFAYNGSLTNINKNLENIYSKQDQIDTYKRDLYTSYKTLDDAMILNSKLQDQKSHINDDIRKGMGLFTKINSTINTFGGCENVMFYQKSVGVGQVKRVLDRVYLLTNNQFVTFGECTDADRARPGDIVQWKGYLVNGVVSAVVIRKLK